MSQTVSALSDTKGFDHERLAEWTLAKALQQPAYSLRYHDIQ